ncbi:translation initiation factor 2 [Streptomyces sp. DT2A-34]|uniref:translation initiation factor 2 n=1 Tax=Streptomyces sp. DT2A-34 TaxID=3051182 RepID=UPI00265B7F9F|nr:translation initiation factor 2 [Streptomyces sp. DT2A-34]MDO0912829.1 translation initiation factor 2 [Streptomyces sp. DT2A-34]
MSPDDANKPAPTCENSRFRPPTTGRLDTYGRRATGDGRRATGDGRRATGDGRTVLFAARSAVALYRLLDVLPIFSGDDRITRLFTLVPGSDFGADALTAIDAVGGRTVPWSEACERTHDLVVAASPKGDLRLLRGPHVLLPHGAGFNKSLPDEGSADSASGLDPAYLRRTDHDAPIALHALAHPDQVARLAATNPQAARNAKVIGDLTLERVLASAPLRDRYRSALGTGARKLLVLVSTWGPDSLIRQRPGLPARLAAQLPYDEYQLALVVHPNERSLLGTYELTERLAPALDAGMVLPDPHEEWASVLIAADALVTDHGSAALYYCAAQDRPIVSVHPGGGELIPGSPMDVLLTDVPQLERGADIIDALRAYRPGPAHTAAQAAFSTPGDAVDRLRTEAYALLALAPPTHGLTPRLLPEPAPAKRVPAAFDVHVETTGAGVRITRHPAGTGLPGHHLAVEHGAADERLTRSAGLLYRRPLPPPNAPVSHTAPMTPLAPVDLAWTSDGWTRHALSAYPGCRSAAALLPSGGCLIRIRGHEQPYAVQIDPRSETGRVARIDPAIALSAVYARLVSPQPAPGPRTELNCLIADRSFRITLRPATDTEASQVI